jgi:hypothetical protein
VVSTLHDRTGRTYNPYAGTATSHPCQPSVAVIRMFHVHGGMAVSGATRVKALEEENRRLKQLLALAPCSITRCSRG